MSQSKVPILTYHSIDSSGSVVSTDREAFRRQMQTLSAAGYRTVSLSELSECIHQQHSLPVNAVVVAFDDGYRNVYREAFPILAEFGFQATVFLITGYGGKTNDWPGDWASPKGETLLSWSEVKELHKHGFEFGSHTSTHPDLTKLPLAQAEIEIKQSQAAIQDRLGSRVTLFAYPYGSYNPEIKNLVQEHFRAACTTRLGKVDLTSDPFSLKRVDAYYLSSQRVFDRLLGESLDWYLRARQALRDVKELSLSVSGVAGETNISGSLKKSRMRSGS